jgi:hypothetical protein
LLFAAFVGRAFQLLVDGTFNHFGEALVGWLMGTRIQ